MAQLVPTGLPSHGEPGERGGLLQASERQGTCRWPTLSPAPPRLRPSLLGLRLWRSSCLYTGKEVEKSNNYPDSSYSQDCGQASPMPGCPQDPKLDGIREKTTKTSFLFSLPAAFRCLGEKKKKKNSCCLVSLHHPK